MNWNPFLNREFPFVEDTYEARDLYGLVCRTIKEVERLQKLINDFDIEGIEEVLSEFENKISAETDEKIRLALQDFREYINSDVISTMTSYQELFNNQLLVLKNDLEQQIQDIEVGDINAYDPTTGQYENINTVLNNIYNMIRNALTCTEFDNLELTATEFDAMQISAYNFDVNGKLYFRE